MARVPDTSGRQDKLTFVLVLLQERVAMSRRLITPIDVNLVVAYRTLAAGLAKGLGGGLTMENFSPSREPLEVPLEAISSPGQASAWAVRTKLADRGRPFAPK
jgi:hypothetical protein